MSDKNMHSTDHSAVSFSQSAARAGLIVAALNWRLTDQELAQCVNPVEPGALIARGMMAASEFRVHRATISAPGRRFVTWLRPPGCWPS